MNHKDLIWRIIESAKKDDPYFVLSKLVDFFIISLIFVNVFLSIIDTVESIHEKYGMVFQSIESASLIIFSIEYFLRVYSCVAEKGNYSNFIHRVRFMLKPMSIIDLLCILPLFIYGDLDLRTLRLFRTFRIFRILKIGRYSKSLQNLCQAFANKSDELILTIVIIFFLILISSSLLFLCEHEAQPENFSSIPASMWWGVITLTTIGYGDVYPITLMGKLFTAAIAVLGLGLFALPAGIIASGFSEIVEEKKVEKNYCSKCGEKI